MTMVIRSATTRKIIASRACPYCKARKGENCTRPAAYDKHDRFPQPMLVVHDQRKDAA